MGKKHLILDTDMAGDCDDAGALALLHGLCDLGEAELLCVTNCISSEYGSGCIDAINRYYSRPVPVGNLKEKDLYNEERYSAKYNRYIVSHYENAYPTASLAADAVTLIRDTLAARSRPDVTLCCIGPLRVAARLLQACGAAFLRSHVQELVVMGGQFAPASLPWRQNGMPGIFPEYNIVGDVQSARFVADHWPTPLVFCGYEIGYGVISGRGLIHPADEQNPVSMAYQRYGTDGRDSWDPLTVYYAVRGEDGLMELSPPGRISVDEDGMTDFTQEEAGLHRFLVANASKPVLALAVDKLLQPAAETRVKK